MSSPNAFASFSIFKGDITTQDFMHLVRESDGSVVGWIDQNGTPQGTLATGGGGGTSIFVNSVLVPNPNFLSGAGINLQVVGSNVSVINTGVTSINSLLGAVSLTQGSGITITPSGNSLIFSASGGAAGVSSLNTLTGALSLIAGTNVSFNSTSSSITVNAATAATVTPWADIQAFGGNPHKFAFNQPTAACTTVGGSPNVTLSASGALYQSLKNGQGICIWEVGNVTAQTGGAPTAPTCTSPAVHGAQTITYQIVGYDNFGGLTAASSAATVTNAPAVFSPLPVAIATASASGGVVTLTFTGVLNNTIAAGMTIHVINITGSGATWNGVWTLASGSYNGGSNTTTVTYNVSGATGTGTLSASSTGRLSNSQPITAISLAANGLITITTAQAHNYQVGTIIAPTEIIIENCTPAYLNGYYSIVSASGTSITVQSGFYGSAVSGSVTAGISTTTVWEHIVVAGPQLATGCVGYYVYSDNGTGNTPTLIGKVPMGDCNFEDYGQCFLAGYSAPSYVPSTPPGAPQNQMFTSTIVSGGGTVNLVLANNVPTGISALGATLMYDDGPNLIAAMATASGNLATAGSVILTPPNSNSEFSEYIFNSPITVPENINVIFACGAIINETWTYTALNQVNAQFGSSSTASPSFATQNFCNINGSANPFFFLGENTGNTGGITIDGLNFSFSVNGQIGIIDTCFFTRIANCGFKGGANAFSGNQMAIVYLGSSSLSEAENLNWVLANRFYAAGTGPVGQSNLGPCRLPAIHFRGSTNTALPNHNDNTAQFTFRGKHSANGRGITFDHQYCGGNSNQGPMIIGAAIWMQQGTTPIVSVIGDIFYGFKLTNILNDTSIAPALANMSLLAHDFTVDGCSSGSTYSTVAGNPVINLAASGNTAQLQAQFQKPSIAVFMTGSTIVDVISVANSSSSTSWKLFAMNQSAQLDLSSGLAYIQYVFNGLVTVVHSNTPGMEFGIEITVGNS